MRVQTIVTSITLTLSLAVYSAMAGNMTPPPGGPSAGSGMPTTKAIFQQLSSGTVSQQSTVFQGPTAGPGSSGRSLKEIAGKLPVADNANGAKANEVAVGKTFWGLRTDGTWGVQTGTSHIAFVTCQTRWTGLHCDVCTGGWSGANCDVAKSSQVNKTGQTDSYAPFDDGVYEFGIYPVVKPTGGIVGAYNTPALTNSPRFTENKQSDGVTSDGTVTDNQTGLIWLKDANCIETVGSVVKTSGYLNWSNALIWSNNLASGKCGLNDGSVAGQWRLPNINELHSLGPTWPPGTPFTAVQGYYWSSSSIDTGSAWYVGMDIGGVFNYGKFDYYYVWPVRSGQ